MAQPSKSIWGNVLKLFLNSFKPRQFTGTQVGTDYLGNKYYEIKADSSVGKRRERWFEPPIKDDFMQEMPAEWESWLRGRRKHVPTEEEIMRNVAIMQIKKKNAIEVDKKGGLMTPMTKGVETFPKRSEYEVIPGKKQGEK